MLQLAGTFTDNDFGITEGLQGNKLEVRFTARAQRAIIQSAAEAGLDVSNSDRFKSVIRGITVSLMQKIEKTPSVYESILHPGALISLKGERDVHAGVMSIPILKVDEGGKMSADGLLFKVIFTTQDEIEERNAFMALDLFELTASSPFLATLITLLADDAVGDGTTSKN